MVQELWGFYEAISTLYDILLSYLNFVDLEVNDSSQILLWIYTIKGHLLNEFNKHRILIDLAYKMPKNNQPLPPPPLPRWPQWVADDTRCLRNFHFSPKPPSSSSTSPHGSKKPCISQKGANEAKKTIKGKVSCEERHGSRWRRVSRPRWQSGSVLVVQDGVDNMSKENSKSASIVKERIETSKVEAHRTGDLLDKVSLPEIPKPAIHPGGKRAIRRGYLASTAGLKRRIQT